MGNKPTYDDANLILRLYEQRREDKMRAAREWFAQNFKFHTIEDFNRGCPPGSSMNAYARMIMSYWEMAASFVTSGVLNARRWMPSGSSIGGRGVFQAVLALLAKGTNIALPDKLNTVRKVRQLNLCP